MSVRGERKSNDDDNNNNEKRDSSVSTRKTKNTSAGKLLEAKMLNYKTQDSSSSRRFPAFHSVSPPLYYGLRAQSQTD